jgi:predicted secreted protein
MPRSMKIRRRAVASLLMAVLAGCAPASSGTANAPVLLARYAGNLPCADCPALRMELALYVDRGDAPTTYEQRLIYVATRDGDRTFTTTGRWTIRRGSATDPTATVYELDTDRPDERQFLLKVGDRALRLLDRDRAEIPSPLPQVLLRAEPEVVGTPITVTEADLHRTVMLRAGQEVVVRLASNRTTGYRWSLVAADDPVLALLASPVYVPDPAAAGAVGVGGTEVWRLSAFRAGAQTLSFEYRRPWERDTAAARTVSLSVTVR